MELAWEVPSSFWWKSDSFMGTLSLKEETLRPSINTAERCILFLTENGCFLCSSWYSFVPVSYTWICSFFVHCKKQRDCHITMGDKRCNNPLHSSSKVDAEETTLKSLAFSMAIRFVRLSPRETKDIDR